jgi:hypothetical protein
MRRQAGTRTDLGRMGAVPADRRYRRLQLRGPVRGARQERAGSRGSVPHGREALGGVSWRGRTAA